MTGPPRPMLPMVTGDFLTCCGDERGPRGEKTAWETEKGVEAAGVGAAPWCCEGVLPCCDSGSLPGVGVDMATARADYCVMGIVEKLRVVGIVVQAQPASSRGAQG